MSTPTGEKMKQMPYSEVKKLAREKGIRQSMKKEKLIAAILAKEEATAEDSFVAMENKIINSSRKNKIDKFNQDNATPSATPRRETYSLDTPTIGISLPTPNDDWVVSSASPQLKKTPPRNEELNVTLTRGSEKKSLKKRKVSFVTPVRRSSRLSSATPHYASVKDRPKTPIPTRMSSGGKRNSLSVGGKKILTPASGDLIEADEVSEPLADVPEMVVPLDVVSQEEEECPSPKGKSNSATKRPIASQTAKSETKRTPVKKSGIKRTISPSPAPPSKVKVTPDFRKLHQKEFDKMESIAEYQLRKEATSAKKIKEHLKFHDPAKSSVSKRVAVKKTNLPRLFGGIPFIPTVTSTKFMKTNFASVGSKPNFTAGKKPATKTAPSKANAPKLAKKNIRNLPKSTSAENTPLRKKRFNFDLQASLSKKLPYKPHKGPLKPIPVNVTSSTIFVPTATSGTQNIVVKAKRAESREVLQGVRKNRRFALQMSNRKIA